MRGGFTQAIVGQMAVAKGSLRPRVAEQAADRVQTDPGIGEDRGVAMPQVVKT